MAPIALIARASTLNQSPLGSHADPFNAAVVPMTAHGHRFWLRCYEVEACTGWSAELETRNGRGHFIPAIQLLMREQLSNPMLMHALLSHAFGFMVMTHPVQKDRYFRSALSHANPNLRVIRELLQNLDGSKAQLMIVLHLIYFQILTECHLGNF